MPDSRALDRLAGVHFLADMPGLEVFAEIFREQVSPVRGRVDEHVLRTKAGIHFSDFAKSLEQQSRADLQQQDILDHWHDRGGRGHMRAARDVCGSVARRRA